MNFQEAYVNYSFVYAYLLFIFIHYVYSLYMFILYMCLWIFFFIFSSNPTHLIKKIFFKKFLSIPTSHYYDLLKKNAEVV